MELQELITTGIGLFNLFTIGFVIVMAAYIFRFVKRHMDEDERSSG